MNESQMIRKAFAAYSAKKASQGITYEQKDLARDLGVSPGFISHLMTGKNELSLTRAINLARILDCHVSDLSDRLATELSANAAGIKLADKTAYKTVAYICGDVVDAIRTILKGKAVSIDEFLHWPHEHSDKTYALEVTSRAMEPRIKAGAVVIVDTERKDEVGKVAALIRNDSLVLAESQGDGVYRLENQTFPDPTFKMSDDDVFVGLVIGQQSAEV